MAGRAAGARGTFTFLGGLAQGTVPVGVRFAAYVVHSRALSHPAVRLAFLFPGVFLLRGYITISDGQHFGINFPSQRYCIILFVLSITSTAHFFMYCGVFSGTFNFGGGIGSGGRRRTFIFDGQQSGTNFLAQRHCFILSVLFTTFTAHLSTYCGAYAGTLHFGWGIGSGGRWRTHTSDGIGTVHGHITHFCGYLISGYTGIVVFGGRVPLLGTGDGTAFQGRSIGIIFIAGCEGVTGGHFTTHHTSFPGTIACGTKGIVCRAPVPGVPRAVLLRTLRYIQWQRHGMLAVRNDALGGCVLRVPGVLVPQLCR